MHPLAGRGRDARVGRGGPRGGEAGVTVAGATVSGDTTVRGTPLIELAGVTRTFKTPAGVITAVDNVSLALGQGEAMCIVGESGCGKTTTGRMLAGLLQPSSGRLMFEGANVWETKGDKLAAFRRSVQLVHQEPDGSLNPIRTASHMRRVAVEK